jgi:AcrR family transcriptional regulator
MPRQNNKRERLVTAARQLIHQQGYSQTTLADIAEQSGVPLGNVYYYFKTKDELATAVVDQRREEFQAMYRLWEQDYSEPRQRLRMLLDLLIGLRDSVAEHGCPVGGLCQELNNQRNELTDRVDSILRDQLAWVKRQFHEMGREDAEQLAIHLVALLQGTSLLANSLNNAEIVVPQLEQAKAWLDNL